METDSQSPDLTRKYSAFSKAAESTLLGRGTLGEEDRCKGRGTPLVFRWASQQKPNRQGCIYPEKSTCFWSALSQRLLEYRRCKRGIQGSAPGEVESTGEWLSKKCLQGASGTLGGEKGLKDIMGTLADGIGAATDEQLRIATDLARGLAQESLKELRDQKALEYRNWVMNNTGGGAKLLHSWTKKGNENWENPGEQNPDPTEAMEERVTKWQGYWSPDGPPDVFPEDHPQWLEEIRGKAEEALQEREPIRNQHTAAEIKAAPKATAHGGDFWKAREWEALGPEGAEAVSEILNQVEIELKWPAQVLLNLIVYLAKAGGENVR